MEEFRLGAVQSSLSILCHMVSLIAGFFPLWQGGTPKEKLKKGRERKKNWSGAKVGLFWCRILWLASKLSLKGVRPFSWYRLIWGSPLNLAQHTLLRAGIFGCWCNQAFREDTTGLRVQQKTENNRLEHRQQCCSRWSFSSPVEKVHDTGYTQLCYVLPAALWVVSCSFALMITYVCGPCKTSRGLSARVSQEMDGNQSTSNSTKAASTVIRGLL